MKDTNKKKKPDPNLDSSKEKRSINYNTDKIRRLQWDISISAGNINACLSPLLTLLCADFSKFDRGQIDALLDCLRSSLEMAMEEIAGDQKDLVMSFNKAFPDYEI